MKIKAFLLLCHSDRVLLVWAWFVLLAIRLGFRRNSFQSVERRCLQLGNRRFCFYRCFRQEPERIAWAVRTASRYIPGSRNCLIQALAAQVLLRQKGLPSQLRFGVAREQRSRLQAHAWLESQGKIVIGGSDRERFRPLSAAGEKSS